MVAIRKRALQLLALGLMTTGMAMAQSQMICTSFGVPADVRAEGQAELMGDITLLCQRADQFSDAGVDQQVTITVQLLGGHAVTNNINFGFGSDIVDAVLTVNGADDESPVVIATPGEPQFGRLVAGQRIEWAGVTIPYPAQGETSSVRITSIRSNPSAQGITDPAQFGTIQARISVSPPNNVIVTDPIISIADIRVGLLSEIDGVITGLQCIEPTEEDGTTTITLTEGFPSAFKTIGVPSFVPGDAFWESGYYAPGSNNWGGASQATQFRLTFAGIPNGVTVTVPNSVSGTGLLEIALVGEDCFAGGTTQVTTSVVYYVCRNDPFTREEVAITIDADWNIAPNPPDVGAATVGATFYPLAGPDSASLTWPEPRFVDTSVPEEFFTMSKCVTTLLFPFVTNFAGFDTGLVISNTSDDWGLNASTDPQEGVCEVHYIANGVLEGNALSFEETSDPIAPGDQLTWLVSAGTLPPNDQGLVGNPGFQGYVLAACEFQYAHGYAFITNNHMNAGGMLPNMAQGYLALIIPADRSLADGGPEALDN